MAAGAPREAERALAELLEGRPGWRLEPAVSPGAPARWTFRRERDALVSLCEGPTGLELYWPGGDETCRLRDAAELEAWLASRLPEALAPKRPPLRSRLRSGGFFRWS